MAVEVFVIGTLQARTGSTHESVSTAVSERAPRVVESREGERGRGGRGESVRGEGK